MTNREQVLRQALSLTPEDRAYVAAALEESLPVATPSQSDSATATELLRESRRRSAEFRNGTTGARLASEVLEELRRTHSAKAVP
jgi:hypothetical protein